jgi:hypothetical protein
VRGVLHDADKALASTENEKSQCDADLQNQRQAIATFSTQIEMPTDEQLRRPCPVDHELY